jgi:DNA mismatch repair protein MutL
MTTRARGADFGVELVVEGGGSARVGPAGCAVGTSVEVADLFFNVPARRKFVKATATESAHVGDIVSMAALARPDVAFTLVRDGKTAREVLRAGSRRERARQAMGDERLEACEGRRGPARIEAYLGAPERARAGATALHLFVNARPVKDRALARAVAQAYGSVLEPGRYPVGVVYIELPPADVDVNVHPQKAEVRFADARTVYDAVTRELHAALAAAFAVPDLGPPGSRPWFVRGGPSSSISSGGGRAPESSPPMSATNPSSTMPSSDERAPPTAPAYVEPRLFAKEGLYGRLRFLAQVRATFLVCEGDDAIYVLDQHAAAERVTFDRLRRAFASRAIAVQRLLIPEVVELPAVEVALLEEAASQVSALGVEARAAGPTAVAVHGVPKILARARPDRLVRDLAAELGRAAGRPFGGEADLVLATMACHGSIRAGDAVTPEEAKSLLDALDAVDFAGHCPHGRPVVTRLGFDELERRLGR